MKQVLIAGLLAASSVVAFGQGGVNYQNHVVGSIISHVYSPNPSSPSVAQTGNSSVAFQNTVRSGDFPTGTTTYGGVLIGGASTGSGPTGYGNGNNFSAELYAAATTPGNVQPGSALQPVVASLGGFLTTAASSGWIANGGTVQIPGTTPGGSATVQAVVWYNGGGTITYAQAQGGAAPWGASPIFNVDVLSGTTTSGQIFNQDPAMTGWTSFSLVNSVPEPSTIAMGVMGVCAFLVRRRK